jgi:hypothetical protein
VELTNGRLAQVLEGDVLIGAFGTREATLEAVGDWKSIGSNLAMHALTGAGLFGRCTSRSPLLPSLMRLSYDGHVLVKNHKVSMASYVTQLPQLPFEIPVVLVVGTSMSAGKTTSARIITRHLTEMGLQVVAAKITGAGRYRDILSIGDAGANHIFDFVDVGLPSTVCPEEEFRSALAQLLTRMAQVKADVAILEAGASPLEPYNGAAAIDMIHENVRCTVLAASDPYAVVGVETAFDLQSDLVTGVATTTQAGIRLIEKLTGTPALNLMQKDSWPQLVAILKEKLAL